MSWIEDEAFESPFLKLEQGANVLLLLSEGEKVVTQFQKAAVQFKVETLSGRVKDYTCTSNKVIQGLKREKTNRGNLKGLSICVTKKGEEMDTRYEFIAVSNEDWEAQKAGWAKNNGG